MGTRLLSKLNNKATKTLVGRILIPIVILMSIQVVLLYFIVWKSQVLEHIEDGQYSKFYEKTVNESNLLMENMAHNWSDIDVNYYNIIDEINSISKESNTSLEIAIKDHIFNQKLLGRVSKHLLNILEQKNVNGVFLVLDGPSNIKGQGKAVECLIGDGYSRSYINYSSVLYERGDASIAKKNNIGLSSTWYPDVVLEEGEKSSDFFYKPLNAARKNRSADPKLLGYWSNITKEDGQSYLMYTRPLISSSYDVIGVIGIQVSYKSVIEKMNALPFDEKNIKNYYICKDTDVPYKYEVVLSNEGEEVIGNKNIVLGKYVYDNIMEVSNLRKPYVATHVPLELYEPNTPFYEEKWKTINITAKTNLLECKNTIRDLIFIWIFLVFLIGNAGIDFIKRIIIRPIDSVVEDLKNSEPERERIKLNKLNIKEIDNLTDAIDNLSDEIVASYERISRLFKISQLTIGTFDYNEETGFVYCSGNFKKLLNWEVETEQDCIIMSAEEFRRRFKEMTIKADIVNENEFLLQVIIDENKEWLTITTLPEEGRMVGIISNVTKDIIEKNKTEYERDFDTLTNIFNLGAFNREVYGLFEKEDLKIAALVMWDLDNLKYINDTYGHNFGDQYLQAFASCISYYQKENWCFARRSGDEFYLFVYGYDHKNEIEIKLSELFESIKEKRLRLPDGQEFHIRVSAGVAWYPENSTRLEELFRFADFTMYQAKKNSKGCMTFFDKDNYLEKVHIMDGYEVICRFFEYKLVKYAYQPIIEVDTGKVFGYEILMRSNFEDETYSAEDLLRMARTHAKLYPMEYITWFEGMKSYVNYLKEGKIEKEAYIFVNSIGNKWLLKEDLRDFEEKYGQYLDHVVIEITESDESEYAYNISKTEFIKKWGGKLAIDDFGSGYNSTAIMLFVKPDIVKVDRSIVCNIDKDENRQNIFTSFVNYAKGMNVKILAEGVETEEELNMVVKLGADLIQGYYFSKPSFDIESIDEKKINKMIEQKEKF